MTTKVFVGNLDFQTTDQALADAFVDCGKVKSGVIITRGRRSLGYGFVEFESADSADKAVQTKNGTELSKRQIKVELVRDPGDRPTRTREGQSADQKDAGQGQGGQGQGQGGQGQDQAGGQRRRRTRFGGAGGSGSGSGNRRFARRTGGGGGNGGGSGGNNSNSSPTNKSGNNSNTGGGNNNTNSNQSGNQSDNQNKNQKPKRRPRRNRNDNDSGSGNTRNTNQSSQNPPKEKILSKTAIFVANIPFEAKDEDLKNFFNENNPKSAHVVTTQTGRSRGYGFVDFDNEKDQQQAIQTKNKAKWPSNTPEKGDREISVSASHSQPKEETAQSSQKE
jgi:RNA recognition motif-containing protein